MPTLTTRAITLIAKALVAFERSWDVVSHIGSLRNKQPLLSPRPKPNTTLESRYVHEGITIDPSFYNDLSNDSVAKFTVIGFDCLLSLDEKICPRNLKANMAQDPFDERYKLVPEKMSSLKAKQPKKPPPKKTRNVGKSKRTQLSTSSSTESPPSDNGDFPSTKLSHLTKAKTRGVTYV
ncbi:hypothetical protein Tco_1387608 [Tanacetum coccineum]